MSLCADLLEQEKYGLEKSYRAFNTEIGVGLWETSIIRRAKGTISLTAMGYTVLSLVVVASDALTAFLGISMLSTRGVSISWAIECYWWTHTPLPYPSNDE